MYIVGGDNMKVRSKMLNIKYLSKTLIYILFILATKQIVKFSDLSPVILWAIAIIVIMMDLFYSYLKYQTEMIMILLAEANDTHDINKRIKHIENIDLFKGMKNSLVIPKILLAFDTNNPQEVLNITKEHEHFLKSSLDYLLILRHSNFKALAMLEDNEAAKEAYKELLKLKDTNIKNKDMKLLFNWDQIESLYQYTLKKYTFSLKLYDKVDTTRYNQREKLQYYFEKYNVAQKLNNQKLIDQIHQEIKNINPTTNLLK